jgi:hypothetical protein
MRLLDLHLLGNLKQISLVTIDGSLATIVRIEVGLLVVDIGVGVRLYFLVFERPISLNPPFIIYVKRTDEEGDYSGI